MIARTILVCDASALIDILGGTKAGTDLERRVRLTDHELHTPSVCDVEVVATLRRHVLLRKIPIRRAQDLLTDYQDLRLQRHAHTPLLERMLALLQNFTAADASYVALCESLGADLLTTDNKLARAALAHAGVRSIA